MRYTLLLLLILLTLTFTACSYVTEFVVVNESAQTVEVRYKIKKSPYEPPTLNARPAKMAAAQLGSRHRQQWQNLNPDEYQLSQENRTVTVRVMPHEALWVTNMFHYFGDDDPNDVANWPIEEISVTGADGGMMFTGQKARKSFSYVSRVLYTLTYK